MTGFSTSHDQKGLNCYRVVAYTDGAGRPVAFRDRVGSKSPLYRRGETVTVLYPRKGRQCDHRSGLLELAAVAARASVA